MVKVCITFVLVLVLFSGGFSAVAQGPIGTPLAPAPGSSGPGQPLQPLPGVIGQPIPGFGQMLPTWQALPTSLPPLVTATPVGWYTVTAQVIVFVRTCPSDQCYVIGRLLPGDSVLVRWAGPGWVQIESGYLAGEYAHADLFR